MSRLHGILVSLAVVMLLAPAGAEGHYKGRKYWYFDGVTRNAEGNPVDPVNIFYFPWGTHQARVEAHLDAHWRPIWDRHDEISTIPKGACRGDQYLRLSADERYNGGGYRVMATSFHGVGYTRREPSYRDCTTRFHSRMWEDGYHGSLTLSPHSAPEAWVVGGVHKEAIKIRFPVRGVECRVRPAPCRPRLSRQGHEPTKDWDAVEYVFFKKMARAGRSGHLDHAGRGGGHCKDYRWKPLPGSAGRIQRYHSDGRITRISMSHC